MSPLEVNRERKRNSKPSDDEAMKRYIEDLMFQPTREDSQ